MSRTSTRSSPRSARRPSTRPAAAAASSTPTSSRSLPGSRAAGPARTVRCAQDDNLMVHAAMAELQPGEVLVLTMPEPRPVALVGDLLATQAKVHGAAAVLVDASVRDVEELAELGLPIWARWVRVQGAVKRTAGSIGEPVRGRRRDDPPGRRGRARRRRRRGGRARAARRGARGVAGAGGGRARQARQAPAGRAVVRPRRAARSSLR